MNKRSKPDKDVANPESSSNDERVAEHSLRPQRLDDFIGQAKIREQINIFISAAQQRNEPLDHVLIASPPGLGKTTLATVIANEMDAALHITSGPALERPGDAAAALTALRSGDVLFIDEIHRLHPAIEESLYSALEDRRFDVMTGSGIDTAAMSLALDPFTMIGATTRVGLMSAPLCERFGIQLRIDYYPPEEISQIVRRSAKLLAVKIDANAVAELASRARGTPRIANRLLRRVRDFAQVRGSGKIDLQCAKQALEMLEVDERGLVAADKRYLEALMVSFSGGPAGLDTIAIALSESADTVENFVEPFLIQQGYIARTARGRVMTERGWKLAGPERASGPLYEDLAKRR